MGGSGRAIGEDTRIQTSVKGLVGLVAAVVVVTSTVLGTWWSLSNKVDQSAKLAQDALDEMRGLKTECEIVKERTNIMWQAHYGPAAIKTAN